MLDELRTLGTPRRRDRRYRGTAGAPAILSYQAAIEALTATYDAAIEAAAATLVKAPLTLTWLHLIHIENAAKKLSKAAYGHRPETKSKAVRGAVLLSNTNVHEIWRNRVAKTLCNVSIAEGDTSAEPNMAGAVIVRNAVIALLCPGTEMGLFGVTGNTDLKATSVRQLERALSLSLGSSSPRLGGVKGESTGDGTVEGKREDKGEGSNNGNDAGIGAGSGDVDAQVGGKGEGNEGGRRSVPQQIVQVDGSILQHGRERWVVLGNANDCESEFCL